MIGLQYVFDSKIKPTVKVGDNVTVEGVKDEHNGIEQIIKYTVKTNSEGNAVTYSEPKEITAANIAEYNTNLGYVKHFTRLLSGNSIHEEVLHERLWSSSGRHTILLVFRPGVVEQFVPCSGEHLCNEVFINIAEVSREFVTEEFLVYYVLGVALLLYSRLERSSVICSRSTLPRTVLGW